MGVLLSSKTCGDVVHIVIYVLDNHEFMSLFSKRTLLKHFIDLIICSANKLNLKIDSMLSFYLCNNFNYKDIRNITNKEIYGLFMMSSNTCGDVVL